MQYEVKLSNQENCKRKANMVKTELLEQPAGARFQVVKRGRISGEDIVGAANGLKFRHSPRIINLFYVD